MFPGDFPNCFTSMDLGKYENSMQTVELKNSFYLMVRKKIVPILSLPLWHSTFSFDKSVANNFQFSNYGRHGSISFELDKMQKKMEIHKWTETS